MEIIINLLINTFIIYHLSKLWLKDISLEERFCYAIIGSIIGKVICLLIWQ
jgi:hypothetical protein